MNFNFGNAAIKFEDFIAAMAKVVPVVGEAIITLHPNNPNELAKIQLGVQVIQGVAAILHQSAAEPTPAAASNPPAPATASTAYPAITGAAA